MASSQNVSIQSHLKPLLLTFAGWKALLLSIALGTSVAPAYDTSTSLALGLDVPWSSGLSNGSSLAASWTDLLTERLTRWDAIYFIRIASRGYLYEQEWAFGTGLPLLVSWLASGLGLVGLGAPSTSDADYQQQQQHENTPNLDPRTAALLSILVATTSHLLAVLTLYKLTDKLFPERRIAFLTALLHIFSPAGLFLAAPCAESLFAFLTFAGLLVYAHGCYRHGVARGLHVVLTGGLLGLATACRSNGILNGVIFAVEAAVGLLQLARRPSLGGALSLLPVMVGGLLVGAGSAVPQWVAYRRYCVETDAGSSGREWCARRIPSIYNFVQSHYWNTGFLRYWTLPNIPLFLLASPVLYLLTTSANDCLHSVLRKTVQFSRLGVNSPDHRLWRLIASLSVVQVALALAALMNYHVQIITRLASGYPIWYVWVAEVLVAESGNVDGDGEEGKKRKRGKGLVMFMVLYALIQGVLFASFLPPA